MYYIETTAWPALFTGALAVLVHPLSCSTVHTSKQYMRSNMALNATLFLYFTGLFWYKMQNIMLF